MWKLIKFSFYFFSLQIFGCVYIETFTPQHDFYIQLNPNLNFDSTKHKLYVDNGNIELYDSKKGIYRVEFYKAEGGKTKLFGQVINEVSNGHQYDRLFLYKWEDNFNKKNVFSLSYNSIIELDSFPYQGVIVYKVP